MRKNIICYLGGDKFYMIDKFATQLSKELEMERFRCHPIPEIGHYVFSLREDWR